MNTSLMRNGVWGMWRHVKRQELFFQASKAQTLQRDLVQKSLHQLEEYNSDSYGAYLKPIITAQQFEKNWDNFSQGACAEETADLFQAKETIANYEKIYSIFEHCSNLNHLMMVLERRIDSNNSTIPMNIYRHSQWNTIENIFPEIEMCLQTYYDLIDECADYPEWQRKVRFDLGNTVSFLALFIDESTRDLAVEISPVYARFDAEKQLYFK